MTATLERRKEVLQLAREHNFIILEDDPYYYLYYGDSARYPSYFSLELQESEVGRILSAGPEVLLQAIDRHVCRYFLIHLDRANAVAAFYREKRDVFERAMIKHLSGLAEWSRPEAGMFFWFKLLLGDGSGSGDSEDLIRNKAFERGVLALPGTMFLPSGRKTAYVRAAFSLISAEDTEEAVKRIRDTILPLVCGGDRVPRHSRLREMSNTVWFR
ncbi:pyridoxal phosphate-dependent transferase [Infundibulicybe gibba]|nr:pyridoxal phosphate-dependent transferase [Infundibulicybe gibba]